MKQSSEYKPNLSFGLLLVGPPGSRKTTSVLEAFPNPYIIDCDNNMSGAVRWINDHGKQNFFYDICNVADDGSIVPEDMRWIRMCECLAKAADDKQVQTLVVDSITFVADYLIAHILRVQNRKKMEIQDWGTVKDLMAKLVTKLRSTGKIVVFTAHEKYDKDEMSGVLQFRINWPGQLADNLAAYFSDFWRAEARPEGNGVKFYIRALPTARISLKNSLNLPAEFELNDVNIKKHFSVLTT